MPGHHCSIRRNGTTLEDTEIAKCVDDLRAAGTSRDKDMQALMNNVLSFSDEKIGKVVKLLRLIDGSDGAAGKELRKKTIEALDLPRAIPADIIIDSLAGWLTDTVMEFWKDKLPGWVRHDAFNERKHLLIRQFYTKRIRERPEHEILLTDTQRKLAKLRRFVEHLMLVNADEDVVLDAIDEFLRFSAEYSRLLAEGEVDRNDWRSFFDELQRRWKNILRRHKLNRGMESKEIVGQRVLFEATSDDYRPHLGEYQTAHGYFTAGGYHRLADDDRVWWDPDFNDAPEGK